MLIFKYKKKERYMGASQIILLVLLGINLLVSAYLHGKPQNGDHNIFTSLVNAGILIWVLIAGGFFG
jgi:hypothetical protein